MKFIIRKLNRKNLINNFLKIIKITKIGNWGFKHFYANLPSKWEKSILAIDPNKKDLIEVPKTVLNSMEIITVKNVDEVLKVALTKPLKRVEWVEVDQLSKKEKLKKELSTH